MGDGFARIEVVTDRLEGLWYSWKPGQPLPEFMAGFGEGWNVDGITAMYPEEFASWAYDVGKCPCGGRMPECPMCGGTGAVCTRCGGAGFGANSSGAIVECDCGVVQEHYLKALVEESSFTEHMLEWTFENVMQDQPQLVELAMNVEAWANEMILLERGWLVMNSRSGGGKSYLGAAVLNKARRSGMHGAYFTAPELEEFLLERVAPSRRYESFSEWLVALKRAPLLVLDEYGAQHSSPWVSARFRDILEYRSDRSGFRPTVLLTNSLDEELPDWLLSRLMSPEVYQPHGMASIGDIRRVRELALDSSEECEL